MNLSGQTTVIRVIDDDDHYLAAVSRLLRAVGYAVRSYSSAEDYLRAEEDAAPGCILLDMHMPEMSGPQLLRVLARGKNILPIILVTASSEAWDAARVTEAGAFSFVAKMSDRRHLIKAIDAAIAANRGPGT